MVAKEKKKKFTIIDLGIVIALLVVIVIGVKVLGGNFGSKGETKEVYITVMATDINEGLSEMIKEGDNVSISYSEEAYGTVVKAWEEPYKESQLFETIGEYKTQEIDGKSNVFVVVKCDAGVTDTRILNGNVPLRVGEETPVCGKGYTVNGYIVDVEEEGGKAGE